MLENGTSGAGVPPDRARFDGAAAAARERSRELREQLNTSRARFTRLWSSHAESDQPDASPDLVKQVHDQLVEARERIEHLERALATNRRIGIAIGVVMARYGLPDEQAFELLRERSQVRNKKLRDLAEEVIYTGLL
jgi:ANTAR domain-containing protein